MIDIKHKNALVHLDLAVCQITDRGLRALTSLSKLVYLNLTYNHAITDEGLWAVGSGCPVLRLIDIALGESYHAEVEKCRTAAEVSA